MNRRQAIIGLASSVSAAALGVETAPKGHFLDSVSSEDIESILREVDTSLATWRRFRNKAMTVKARQKRDAKRETRANNTVVWRGTVEEALPMSVVFHHAGQNARRRDVEVYTTTEECAWQGQSLPSGTKILLDSRVSFGNPLGAGAEILETPNGWRVHVWPRKREITANE